MSADDIVDKSRRRFLTATTTVVGGVGAALMAVPFVGSWLPSARAQALGAPVEADFGKLDFGGQMTVEWRGTPVWIIKRTQEVIDSLASLDSKLRDPNSDEEQQPDYTKNAYRSIKKEFFSFSWSVHSFGLCSDISTRCWRSRTFMARGIFLSMSWF